MTALLLVPAQEHDGSFRTGGRTGRLWRKGLWETEFILFGFALR